MNNLPNINITLRKEENLSAKIEGIEKDIELSRKWDFFFLIICIILAVIVVTR
jgi:hypothetical protein